MNRKLWIKYLKAVERMLIARNSYLQSANDNDYADYYLWKGRAGVLKIMLLDSRSDR
jgi:hypothetical protein